VGGGKVTDLDGIAHGRHGCVELKLRLVKCGGGERLRCKCEVRWDGKVCFARGILEALELNSTFFSRLDKVTLKCLHIISLGYQGAVLTVV
jgi:hypothetical protein